VVHLGRRASLVTESAVTRPVTALLDRLGIDRGDLVYAHTSFSRLGHLDLTPSALIDALLDRLGPSGTLVVPSFAWHLDPAARPWKGYAEYFAARPVFDVRNTPSNIGVVPELFRRRPGVLRSAHYWWSVAAHGPLAERVTCGQEIVDFPYGPDSSFGRLVRLDAKVLGLGVTCNTTSLAPVVDHDLGDRHPQQVLTSDAQDGVVIDENGVEHRTRSFWLLPEVVRLIKPSVVMEESAAMAGAVIRVDHESTIQFAYPVRAYYDEGLRLGAEVSG
jgi:aminoglycoside 3-N-acetyltransferase